MKRMKIGKAVAVLLVISMTAQITGCGSNTTSKNQNKEESVIQEETTVPVKEETTLSEENEEATEIVSEENSYDEETEDLGLTEQQKNSFSMLYYLAITAEEIRISKNNRLILDDIYTSLLNDINPGAIDDTTQDHLKNLRDIINSYISISVKRERLQYLYNQDKAATIRSAVPNPIAVLSMTQSLDWKKLAISVAYTVVDSYNNYKSANEEADQNYLMSGWDLDDEETATIQKNRDRAFDYMVDIVQEYGLDGKLTLNEKAIEDFAEICEIESVQQKIRRLESEEETYRLLGNYWLELADCYYETEKYQKCLDCVDKYNQLATGIYRKDYNYVKILPKAIVAAQEIYSGEKYVSTIETFANAIIDNTTTEEWSIRYFAAQTYLDLYARTGKVDYMEAAYNIAYDNVTILLDEQRKINKTYLSDVVETEIQEPDYRFLTEDEKKETEKEFKEEKKRLKEYNKELHEKRKTELPALYEPLILNCDLLFALADEMHISESEKNDIEAILQTEKNGVFIVKPINDRYSFKNTQEDYSINFAKDKLVIPVMLLSDDANISVVVTDNGKSETFDDFTVTKVKRNGETIDTFDAYVSSKKMKNYEWSDGSKITVNITNGDDGTAIVFKYVVSEYKNNWIIPDKVVFEEE